MKFLDKVFYTYKPTSPLAWIPYSLFYSITYPLNGFFSYSPTTIDGKKVFLGRMTTLESYAKFILESKSAISFVYTLYKKRIYDSYKPIPKDKIVLDCGANCGIFSVFAAQRTSAQVHSFEPTSQNFETLQKNIELNKLQNVVTNNIGVGDKNENKTIHIHKENFCHAINLEDMDQEKIAGEEQITIVTIDSYLKKHDINPKDIGFVKIDGEGYELPTLKGMETVLEQNPVIILPDVKKKESHFADIIALLKKHEFRVAYKKPIGLTAYKAEK